MCVSQCEYSYESKESKNDQQQIHKQKLKSKLINSPRTNETSLVYQQRFSIHVQRLRQRRIDLNLPTDHHAFFSFNSCNQTEKSVWASKQESGYKRIENPCQFYFIVPSWLLFFLLRWLFQLFFLYNDYVYECFPFRFIEKIWFSFVSVYVCSVSL